MPGLSSQGASGSSSGMANSPGSSSIDTVGSPDGKLIGNFFYSIILLIDLY